MRSDEHRRHHGVELLEGRLIEAWESPARADLIGQHLDASGIGTVMAPRAYQVRDYAGVHDERYLSFLATAWEQWSAWGQTTPALPVAWPTPDLRADRVPEHIEGLLGYYSFDAACSIGPQTWAAARGSADLALTGADLLIEGEPVVFALCRPPGHHAGAARMGGYCYLNNAAIAAQRLRDHGLARIAILDVDAHHGNGTQSIFYDRSDVLYVSLHEDPRTNYPYFSGFADETGSGAGTGFTVNVPLASGTDWAGYGDALGHAVSMVGAFDADALIVSLGVDTFERDPVSSLALATDDYRRMGQMLAGLAPRVLFVLEGGYAIDEAGVNAVNVLAGFLD